MILHEGDVVHFEGELHRVVMVNESRAVLVPVETRLVEIQRIDGSAVKFNAHRKCKSVSPNSELTIVARRCE